MKGVCKCLSTTTLRGPQPFRRTPRLLISCAASTADCTIVSHFFGSRKPSGELVRSHRCIISRDEFQKNALHLQVTRRL